MSKNDVTGDEISTGIPSEDYRTGYDRIFKKPVDTQEEHKDDTEVPDNGRGVSEDS